MKRYGNLWDKIVTMENLELAYRRARKGKSWQSTIRAFDVRHEEGLQEILTQLQTGSFQTSPYREMEILKPKRRTIYVLPFAPDRIVQHALMNVVQPIWDSLMIDQSLACRKGKGLHVGSTMTVELVKRYSYCLKCDISKFYPSIDHEIMMRIVERKIKDRKVLGLIENIVMSVPGGKNVPIGNYTSQWLGNLYLNELDMMVKHQLKVGPYIRYCDDFVLFDDDKGKLNSWREIIRSFLWDELRLTFSKADLFPVSQGVDFLGYRHFPDKILMRKRTAKQMRARLKQLKYQIKTDQISLEKALSVVESIYGWTCWANAHHWRQVENINQLKEDIRGEIQRLRN